MTGQATYRWGARARGPLRGVVLALFAFSAPALRAQDTSALADLPVASPVVVELFTAQGCSSCPPADAVLERLADQPGIIALALHVDYWDYLGWKDDFADPAFTERQKLYARAAGERMVYTPQAIVDGRERVVGSDGQALMAAVMTEGQRPEMVTLKVIRTGEKLVIEARAARPLPGAVEVQLVRFLPEETIQIAHGENAGLTVTYRNIVTDWQSIGLWDQGNDFTMDAELIGAGPAVVILQGEQMGPILAAALAE